MKRRTRTFTALVSLTLLSGLAAGCVTTSAGEPRPAETATGSSQSGGDPAWEGLPPRPREITLDDVDSCTLIPQSDQDDFYMDEPGELGKDHLDNPKCTWIGTEVGYFALILDVNEGIEVRLDGSYTVVGEITDPILDFGTVTYQAKGDDNGCFVSVDVADGQQLIAQIGIDTPYLDTVPPLCEYAHQLAASAMSTLVES